MEFSDLIGVGFYGFPNASNSFLVGISIRSLYKSLPTSYSDTNATTCHSVFHLTNIAPFLNICHLCMVFLLGD